MRRDHVEKQKRYRSTTDGSLMALIALIGSTIIVAAVLVKRRKNNRKKRVFGVDQTC
jgi:hypothetical protein